MKLIALLFSLSVQVLVSHLGNAEQRHLLPINSVAALGEKFEGLSSVPDNIVKYSHVFDIDEYIGNMGLIPNFFGFGTYDLELAFAVSSTLSDKTRSHALFDMCVKNGYWITNKGYFEIHTGLDFPCRALSDIFQFDREHHRVFGGYFLSTWESEYEIVHETVWRVMNSKPSPIVMKGRYGGVSSFLGLIESSVGGSGRLTSKVKSETYQSQPNERQKYRSNRSPEHTYLGLMIASLPFVLANALLGGWGLFRMGERRFGRRPLYALLGSIFGAITWALLFMLNIPYGP